MRYLRFVLIAAVLFLLPGIGQAGWFWQNPLPQGNTLQSVCFIDNNTGYAVGWLGTIIKTTDGGSNWSILNSGTLNYLSAVQFPLDAQTGYAVGNKGSILKTTNNGATWVGQFSDSLHFFSSICFPVDAQTGYVISGETPSKPPMGVQPGYNRPCGAETMSVFRWMPIRATS